jgi:hypothetical protein
MPKITAVGENATVLQSIPKGIYTATCTREKEDWSKETSAPMICLGFEIDDGDYKGRKVPPFDNTWHRVMVGGRKPDSKGGGEHDLGRWLETINALAAPWTCRACGTQSTKKFVREKGRLYCPHCGQEAVKAGVDFDDTFVGRRCRIIVSTHDAEGFDEPINDVAGLRPLE